MATNSEPDVAEALFSALLSSNTPAETQRRAGRAPPASVLPTLLGWHLEVPRGVPCNFNVVSLYKQHGYVSSAPEQQNGWEACRRLDQLKSIVCDPRRTPTLEALIEYMCLLRVAREHVATNEQPFVYAGIEFASAPEGCRELDFELYMVLSHLAAIDVAHAHRTRAINTRASLMDAAFAYERAAWFLDIAHTELYARAPSLERARHVPEVDWIMELAPRNVTRAAAGALVRARADVMNAEAALCHRAALEKMLSEEPEFADDRDSILDGSAAYCAQLFSDVTRALASNGGVNSRMARYAAVTACRLQLGVATRLAQIDMDMAERDKDANALARAIRRLSHTVLPQCTPDQRSAVAEDVDAALNTVQSAVIELRKRADTLRYNPTGIFATLDLTSPMTEPAFAVVINPAALDGKMEENPNITVVKMLHTSFSVQHQRFAGFFALRAAHGHALRQLGVTRNSATAPGAAREFDTLFKSVAAHLGQLPPERRAQIAEDAELFVEILRAMHSLGALGERERWFDFTFAADDAQNPDTAIVSDIQALQATKLCVAKYLQLLTEGTSVPNAHT
jgi:hypothetical protein